MSQRPSFQFYHGDWRRNSKLRRCSHAERGVWLEVMCLMADEDEFGVLRWPLSDVANAVPCRMLELRPLVERGVMKGAEAGEICKPMIYTPRHAGRDCEPVILLPEQPGPIWYSSRMLRDAYVASNRGKGTRFGDAPKAAPNEPPTRRMGDGPSSSSASAIKSTTAARSAREYPEDFEAIWRMYPKRDGDNPKIRAFKAFRARLADSSTPEEIRAGVERYAAWVRARGKEGTEVVKQAATFFGPEKAFLLPWAVEAGQIEPALYRREGVM